MHAYQSINFDTQAIVNPQRLCKIRCNAFNLSDKVFMNASCDMFQQYTSGLLLKITSEIQG